MRASPTQDTHTASSPPSGGRAFVFQRPASRRRERGGCAFVDRALAEDSPLVRSFWLAGVSEVIAAQPQANQHGLFETASRRIHATFRVEPYERQAAVRTLAAQLLPVP